MDIAGLLDQNTEEVHSVLRALNGEYILPEAGGDLLRDGAGVLPTGRSLPPACRLPLPSHSPLPHQSPQLLRHLPLPLALVQEGAHGCPALSDEAYKRLLLGCICRPEHPRSGPIQDAWCSCSAAWCSGG